MSRMSLLLMIATACIIASCEEETYDEVPISQKVDAITGATQGDFHVGDFNADNKIDILTFSSTPGYEGDVFVGLSNGSQFDLRSVWREDFHDFGQTTRVGQFNRGSSSSDIIRIVNQVTPESGEMWVATSGGDSFRDPSRWSSGYQINKDAFIEVGDVNRDGMADVISFEGDDVWVYRAYYSRYSRSHRFRSRRLWNSSFAEWGSKKMVGDFNGDDAQDIIEFTCNDTGDVFVALSNGSSAFNSKSKWHEWFCITSEQPLVGNFDGDSDGKDDVIAILDPDIPKSNAGYIYVATSNGSQFVNAKKWGMFDYGLNGVVLRTGDVDNDGDDDIIIFHTGGDMPAGFVSVMRLEDGEIGDAEIWSYPMS